MKLWKRNAVVTAVVLFVLVAVYLNWSYNRNQENTSVGKTLGEATLVGSSSGDSTQAGDSVTTGYFSAARLNRQQARDSALSLYQQAAEDTKATQSTLDAANTSIQAMAKNTLAEAEIENLITAKGYTDCVAFLGEDSASIVVSAKEGGLTEADTAKITEIVLEQTKLAANQIKIIEAKP
ncbi:hypothetical protein SDC9_123452 [bioreactor metagenome]|uniref:Stage III sporulation protein AH n=1 Tax=bioreactor metagenome TaxID=1076179 RepID=A0A645CHV0_9ZZZZ